MAFRDNETRMDEEIYQGGMDYMDMIMDEGYMESQWRSNRQIYTDMSRRDVRAVDSGMIGSRYNASEFLVYEVEFKRGRGHFEKSTACAEDFVVGDFVKVEGDRGHDIGVVCDVTVQSSDSVPFFDASGKEVFRKIIGRVSDNEKKNLFTKVRDEDRALHICNELAARRRLPILVVDAEFQFDRNKLTYSYMADSRVDFRELVRDLFSLFKTRIWMQKLDIHGNQIHSSLPSNDSRAPSAIPSHLRPLPRHERKFFPSASSTDLSTASEAIAELTRSSRSGSLGSQNQRQLNTNSDSHFTQYQQQPHGQYPSRPWSSSDYMAWFMDSNNSTSGHHHSGVVSGKTEGDYESFLIGHYGGTHTRQLRTDFPAENLPGDSSYVSSHPQRAVPPRYKSEASRAVRLVPFHQPSPCSPGSHISRTTSGSTTSSSSGSVSSNYSSSTNSESRNSLSSLASTGSNGHGCNYTPPTSMNIPPSRRLISTPATHASASHVRDPMSTTLLGQD